MGGSDKRKRPAQASYSLRRAIPRRVCKLSTTYCTTLRGHIQEEKCAGAHFGLVWDSNLATNGGGAGGMRTVYREKKYICGECWTVGEEKGRRMRPHRLKLSYHT